MGKRTRRRAGNEGIDQADLGPKRKAVAIETDARRGGMREVRVAKMGEFVGCGGAEQVMVPNDEGRTNDNSRSGG